MIWSFSNHGLFRRCQRQWYYKAILANARANDPRRKEAHRLSKLVRQKMWRGRIVDDVISRIVIPAVARKKRITLPEACRIAKDRFAAERSAGLRNDSFPKDFHGFVELQNGQEMPQEAFEECWMEIRQSLENFFTMDNLKNLIKEADQLLAQRSLVFNHDGISVRAVPDLILFFNDRPPFIIDWKVQSSPMSDHWLQLATYAIALSRCKPHKDFPEEAGFEPTAIKLVEAQLLSGEIRRHSVSPQDESDLYDLVSASGERMILSRDGQDAKTLSPFDFTTTSNPNNCQICPFMKMCWEEQNEPT